MPRVAQAQEPEVVIPAVVNGPLEVSVADDVTDSTVRVITLKVKKNVVIPTDLSSVRNGKGENPVAFCDLTGEPIYNEKNVNEVGNSERPEYNGKVLSTKIMKALFGNQQA